MYETNKRQPTLQGIKKICKFFDVTGDYLLDINIALSNDLSDNEHRLLDIYRGLSQQGQDYITAQLDFVLSQHKYTKESAPVDIPASTKIWSEWMPSCKAYKLAGNYNIEMYTPPCENPDDNYNEIWIPVEKM